MQAEIGFVFLKKIQPFLDSNLLCKFFSHFPKGPIPPGSWLLITKELWEVIITIISSQRRQQTGNED